LAKNASSTTSLTPISSKDPLKEDFRNFLWLVWKHLNLPDPTPVQYDIASFLQHGPRRLVIEAFRGVGKSWITAAFVCWTLYCDPQKKIMVVSATKPRADDFSTFTLQLIKEIDVLKHLTPQAGQRESKIAFDVAPAKPDQSPSVKSVGIRGQLAGSRADLIIPDDVEIPNNSDTESAREHLAELIKEFDAVLKPGGRIVYLGTPQTEQSIYNQLPTRGYTVRVWPARYPALGKVESYQGQLAPFIYRKLEEDESLVGKPTDPARFHDEDLLEREMSYGRSGFALQFQLDTSLSDAERYPLKLADLVVMPLDPYKAPIDFMWAATKELSYEKLPMIGLSGDRYHRPFWTSPDVADYEDSVMFVDPSGRGKDETAYALVKQLHGRLFIIASGGVEGGYEDDTLDKLLAVSQRHKNSLILVEPNMGDGMFANVLRARAKQKQVKVAVEDSKWATQQKEARIIDTLEPVMNQHRLVVSPQLIEEDYSSTLTYERERVQTCRLFYQLTRITRDKGALKVDDRLDALSGAVAYFMDSMSRDGQMDAFRYKRDEFDRQLEEFLESGVRPLTRSEMREASPAKRPLSGARRAIR
jgi:hypothetical protein